MNSKVSYKKHYSRFLNGDPGRLHFAAHSHHYWPDCTREAQLQCWDDTAKYADHKWERIFGEIIPKTQKHIATILHTDEPQNICFAPNTHEFVVRLLSCFEPGKPLRVLTTDSEFHSFNRQITRYEELPNVTVERVPTEPFNTFAERFAASAKSREYDLVFLSQVFFNSGFVVNELKELAASTNAVFVVDGYHAFAAIPVDLSAIKDRAFYVAGGYKYAQAGEGACFLHVPAECVLRPLDTGWYAGFSQLERGSNSKVEYDSNGARFWGSTFDASGLYRMNAVFDWWERDHITVENIHAHVQSLQKAFLTLFKGGELLGDPSLKRQGHFLTYKTDKAEQITKLLEQGKIIVDHRGNRLRFGFGLYHDLSDVERLAETVKTLL